MLHHQLSKSAACISEEPVVTGLLNQALRDQISLLKQQPATALTLQQSFLAIADQALTERDDAVLIEKLFVDAYEEAMKVLRQAQLHEVYSQSPFVAMHYIIAMQGIYPSRS